MDNLKLKLNGNYSLSGLSEERKTELFFLRKELTDNGNNDEMDNCIFAVKDEGGFVFVSEQFYIENCSKNDLVNIN